MALFGVGQALLGSTVDAMPIVVALLLTATVIGGLWWCLRRGWIRARWANPVAGALAILLLTNILASARLRTDPTTGMYIGILIVGSSFFLSSGFWCAGVVGLALISWGSQILSTWPNEGWRSMVGPAVAIPLASVVFLVRKRSLNDLAMMQQENAVRQTTLQAALLLAELEIDERKLSESALRESESRYQTLAKMAPVGIFHTDRQGAIRYVNDRWCRIAGLELEHARGDGWLAAVHQDDREQVRVEWRRAVEEGLFFYSEYRFQRADGMTTWVIGQAVPECDEGTQVVGYVGTITDITEQKMVEKQLLHDAFHDGLTGLPNRALFLDRLGRAILHARRRPDASYAVLFMDVDRFKVVNDSLGHMIGDQLLVAVGRRVEQCLRPEDTVARMGGDEFAILLEDLEAAGGANAVANRILKALSHPFSIGGNEVFATASIGIAQPLDRREKPEDVLRNADIAMYQAKSLGEARVREFDASMHRSAVRRLSIETDLRRATHQNEICVHYQPIIRLADGRISGLEALARWNHPKRGFVAPDEFIPIAEETGIITSLGNQILSSACQQVHEWSKLFGSKMPLNLSVNLSNRQFVQSDLLNSIQEVLETYPLGTGVLNLEITEGVIMDNVESVTALLTKLRSLNVRLHIDDFGTGYSSLAYLHRFPIDSLKIDRSFVGRLGSNGENAAIIQAIIDLGRNLEMQVIAEGVETAEQFEALRKMGCPYAQGFYFSIPKDPAETEQLLRSQPSW